MVAAIESQKPLAIQPQPVLVKSAAAAKNQAATRTAAATAAPSTPSTTASSNPATPQQKAGDVVAAVAPTTTPSPKSAPAPRPVKQLGEPATQHTYDHTTKKWSTSTVFVTLEARPFTEGSMRWCFRLTNHSLPEGRQQIVGKMYKTPNEPRQTYFTEIEMQATCATLADEFNKLSPPKKIKFIVPQILEFHHRRWNDGNALIMATEPFLKGEYKKHSNNYGYVNPDERNTPQAFSHFTWHHSKGQMLVCDMQGVEDTYTDPQIHTPDLRFGIADMGTDGMQKFFQSHRCNVICQYMGLPATSFKPTKGSGTVPRPSETSATPANNARVATPPTSSTPPPVQLKPVQISATPVQLTSRAYSAANEPRVQNAILPSYTTSGGVLSMADTSMLSWNMQCAPQYYYQGNFAHGITA